MKPLFAAVLAGGLAFIPMASRADDAPKVTLQQAPASRGQGVAVLAAGASADATWPLARGIYGDASLRPADLDEPHARILAGDAPAEGAPADLKELAELRAGVHGDDAASRQLLASIANRLHVTGILVVTIGEGDAPPSARLFLADQARFDAALYQPDDGSGQVRSWTGAVRSISRSMAPAPAPPPAPASTATPAKAAPAPPKSEPKPAPSSSKPFYLSPWFWGAIGAAAFGAGAVYLATRDTSDGQIHLQMQVPK